MEQEIRSGSTERGGKFIVFRVNSLAAVGCTAANQIYKKKSVETFCFNSNAAATFKLEVERFYPSTLL